MKPIISKCGLCLEIKELQKSHLIPALFYKMMREEWRPNPNPRLISPKKAKTSSSQVTKHLLCKECEARFSTSEKIVSTYCARPGGHFKLRDLLKQSVPLRIFDKVSVYDIGPILGEEIGHFIYFAASIFWRASATNWKDRWRIIKKISLGPLYEEQFRKYLLRESGFPEKAALSLRICSENEPDNTVIFPAEGKTGLQFKHIFYIPGLLFIMYVGQSMPPWFQDFSLNFGKIKMAYLAPSKEELDHVMLSLYNKKYK